MATETSFWDSIGGFVNDGLNTVVNATAGASSIADTWANFGKNEAEIKAEQLAQENARLRYQAQVNATQVPQTNTGFSFDNKTLLIGAGVVGAFLLLRGK